MQGKLVPDGIDWSRGACFALTHDPYLLHFLHRWWAWVVVAALVDLRAAGEADRSAGALDGHPLRVRHPDPARHRHGDDAA